MASFGGRGGTNFLRTTKEVNMGLAMASMRWVETRVPINFHTTKEVTLTSPGHYGSYPQPGVGSSRPMRTPMPKTQIPIIDLNFITDLYELSDMEPSPMKSPPKSKATKTKVGESSEVAPARRSRSLYTAAESNVLAKCWTDVSEDPITANNQELGGFWGRITKKYDQKKTEWAESHKPADLPKHWDRVIRECRKFHGIYDGHMKNLASGENEPFIRQLSLEKFKLLHNGKGFKYWEAYHELKCFSKSRSGLEAEKSRSVRTRLNAEGSCSGGGADLSEVQDPSEPPLRPISGKMAKKRARAAKGKGKLWKRSLKN